MADPKDTPATPPTPVAKPTVTTPAQAPPPKPAVKAPAPAPIPPPDTPIKTVVIEEPTLRDQVAAKLQILLRSDSYRERVAVANAILDLFSPE